MTNITLFSQTNCKYINIVVSQKLFIEEQQLAVAKSRFVSYRLAVELSIT